MSDLIYIFAAYAAILGSLIYYFVYRRTHDFSSSATYAVSFFVVSTLVSGLVIFASSYVGTADVEIINGKITAKDRVHDSYTRSYSCNCRSVCTGSGKNRSCKEVCSTCYEDRYTVSWYLRSTIGNFTVDHLDRSSKSVYSAPDPARYIATVVGEPAAKQSSYTNYILAVPSSLYTPYGEVEKFTSLLPQYPDKVYDMYRITRFLSPGHNIPGWKDWSNGIADMLRELGPNKQVNIIIVVAKTADRNYAYALQSAWQGANKNDVVLVVGSTEWPKIDFVEVLSWTKNELFKIQLRDEVLALKELDRVKTLELLDKHVKASYVRREMKEFEYLSSELKPHIGVTVTLASLMLVVALGFVFVSFNSRANFGRRRLNMRNWK